MLTFWSSGYITHQKMKDFIQNYDYAVEKDAVSDNEYNYRRDWLSCWIHNPVFPGSNPGGDKVDSSFRGRWNE